MLNEKKLYLILNSILSKYKTITELSDAAGIDRGYLSRFINRKLSSLPSPKILKKLAQASKGITTYEELMEVCDYIDLEKTYMEPINEKTSHIPLVYNSENINTTNIFSIDRIIDYIPFNCQDANTFFAFQTNEDSMAPLLNIDDIAIIQKQETNNFENRRTYLLEFEDKIMIRKIVETDKNNIELFAMNPYYPVIKTTKDKITIIGRVIKAENQSAFK